MREDIHLSDNIKPLTKRESEVLQHLYLGKSNKEIANDLVVTPHTAKAHVSSILQKMEVKDRTQAVVKAIKIGLIKI